MNKAIKYILVFLFFVLLIPSRGLSETKLIKYTPQQFINHMNRIFDQEMVDITPYNIEEIGNNVYKIKSITDTLNSITAYTNKDNKIYSIQYMCKDSSFLPRYSPLRKIIIMDFDITLMTIGNLKNLKTAAKIREQLYFNCMHSPYSSAERVELNNKLKCAMKIIGSNMFIFYITILN